MILRWKSLWATLFALCLWGCTDIPATTVGGRILGKISYQGTAHLAMKRPAIRVMVVVDFPPSAGPLGFQIIEQGEQPYFPAQVSYELKGIVPYQYKVVAQLIDIAAPDTAATQLPLGGYPNFCALLAPDQGWLVVTKDAPVTGADFSLYDDAGTDDPCNTSTSICPQAGKATMNLVIQSSLTPTSADRLITALFATFPSTATASTSVVAGSQIAFPQTILDDSIPPGNYAALYVCFDVGGNSGTGLCTSEDAYILDVPPGGINFPADKIVNLLVDLDALTLTVQSVDDPASRGCQ
jgi:hypothetical protein